MATTDIQHPPDFQPAGRWSFRRFAAVFGLFFALGSVWSFASPVSSYPDELAHVIKAAAVASGQWQGQDGSVQGQEAVVSVPSYLKDYPKPPCFAFSPRTTADCTPEIGAGSNDVELTTSAGNYNPLYYSIVGLPALILVGDVAWYAMRVVSVALTSLFAAFSVMSILGLGRHRTTLAAFAVSCTPMVLYLMGGLNPQSLEITATTAVFAATLAVLERSKDGQTMRPYLLMLTISTVVLANTRAVSLVWLALAVIAAVFMGGVSNLRVLLTHRGARLAVYGCAGGSAVGLLWLMTARTFQSLTGDGEQISAGQAFVTMLDRTFDYSTAYVGMFGWLDTPAPNAVYAFWGFLMVGLAVAAASVRPLSRFAGPFLLLTAVILLPPVMQAAVIGDVGYIWQGRYILPLVVPFLLACGYALREADLSHSIFAARMTALVSWLAAAAHLYAFIYVLRRYTVGLVRDANWLPMLQTPLWQPPAWWITWAAAYAAVLAVAVVLLLRTLRGRPAGSRQDPEIANQDKETETYPCS